MKIRLAPSIARGDLMNMEREIRKLEEVGIELIHFDLMDTTYDVYGSQIMLPTDMIPMIKKITSMQLDIHLLVSYPERLFEALLPHCAGSYVVIQAEVCGYNMAKLLKKIQNAGGLPGLAINIGTPIYVIEEALPYIHMVNLLIREGFESAAPLNTHILDKVARTRSYLNEHNGAHISIEVDGSIGMEETRLLVDKGADILVLGTKTIFRQNRSYADNTQDIFDIIGRTEI